MPRQASLAAGVLQTAMRLSIAIGLGITAAAYGSVHHIAQEHKAIQLAYSRVYLCGIAFASLGLLFVPFMKIEPQGRKQTPSVPGARSSEQPRNGGEYIDDTFAEVHRQMSSGQKTVGSKPSKSSVRTDAVTLSEGSFFPRWSWEGERWVASPGGIHSGAGIVYEVCINCLKERKVTLGSSDETLVNNSNTDNGTQNNMIRTVGSRDRHDATARGSYKEWNGGQWNNRWNNSYYAERGVRDGGNGWL